MTDDDQPDLVERVTITEVFGCHVVMLDEAKTEYHLALSQHEMGQLKPSVGDRFVLMSWHKEGQDNE